MLLAEQKKMFYCNLFDKLIHQIDWKWINPFIETLYNYHVNKLPIHIIKWNWNQFKKNVL